MASEGKSPGEICAQLKDRNHNGGRGLVKAAADVAKSLDRLPEIACSRELPQRQTVK
jgi:hypothetical protein